MKIVLIAPTYLPAIRANTIQVMKMAQAIASLGHDLTVLVPQVEVESRQFSWDDLMHQYGLRSEFKIEWLPTNRKMRSYDFGLKSVRRSRELGAELIYTRLPQSAVFASRLGIPTIYEIHDLPKGKMGPWFSEYFSFKSINTPKVRLPSLQNLNILQAFVRRRAGNEVVKILEGCGKPFQLF